MAIHVFTGLPGSGKTVALVAKVLDVLDDEELDVYPNFWIDHDSGRLKPWSRISELLELREGMIVMDEIQIYMNSRAYGKMPLGMQYKLQQHRKQGLHIWGTVQNLGRIDIVMRELVTNYYECSKVIYLPFLGVLYRIVEYKATDWDSDDKKSLRVKYYFGKQRDDEKPMSLPKKIARAYGRYDTSREIEVPEDSVTSASDSMVSSAPTKRHFSRSRSRTHDNDQNNTKPSPK